MKLIDSSLNMITLVASKSKSVVTPSTQKFLMNQERIIDLQKVSFIDLHSKLTHNTVPHNNNVDADDERINYLAPFNLFIKNYLTTSDRKHLDRNDYAQGVCLRFALTSSSKDSNDLSIGFGEKKWKT